MPTVLLVCTAAALGVYSLWLWLSARPEFWIAFDYTSFFNASRLPVDRLYDGPVYQYIYPPTGIILIQALSLAEFWAGYLMLGLGSVLAFSVAVARVSSAKVAALSLLSFAALQGLVWGQTPMLFAAVLIWGLTLPAFRRGIAIGVLASLKPQLFLAAPFVFLVRRDWQTIAGMIVGGLANVVVSIALFGVGPWLDWIRLLPELSSYFDSVGTVRTMVTPMAYAINRGLPLIPFAAAGLAAAAWVIFKSKVHSEPLSLAAVIGGASILASPYALPYDAILVLPAAAAAVLGPVRLTSLPAAALFTSLWTVVALPAFLILDALRDRRRPNGGRPEVGSGLGAA